MTKDRTESLRCDRNEWRDIAKRRQRERDELVKKLEPMQVELDRFKFQNKHLRQKLDNCDKERNELKNKCHKLENDISIFKEKQKKLRSQNNDLCHRIKEWEKGSEFYVKETKSVEFSRKNLKDQLRKLEKERNEWRSKAKKYENEKHKLFKEKNAFKNMYTFKTKQNKKLSVKNKRIKKKAIFRQNLNNYYSSNHHNNNIYRMPSILTNEEIATRELIQSVLSKNSAILNDRDDNHNEYNQDYGEYCDSSSPDDTIVYQYQKQQDNPTMKHPYLPSIGGRYFRKKS